MHRFSILLLLCCAGISAGQVKQRVLLDVSSEPRGCEILLDGKLLGVTPLQGVEILPGGHIVTTKMEWYCPVVDVVEAIVGERLVRSYRLEPAAGLAVTSVPENASVYVNGVLLGTSPVVIRTLRPGTAEVRVARRDYFTWKLDTTLVAGIMDSVATTLEEIPTYVSVDVERSDIMVSVNGSEMAPGPVTEMKVRSGDLLIKAQDPRTGEVAEGEWFTRARVQSYRVQFHAPSRRAFLNSLLFPGLGQYKVGSRKEGILIGSAFAATGVFFLYSFFRSSNAEDDYEEVFADYLKATVIEDAVAKREIQLRKFDDWKNAAKVRNIAGGILIGIYAASLIEAFFAHDAENIVDQISDRPTLMGVGVGPADVRFVFRVGL